MKISLLLVLMLTVMLSQVGLACSMQDPSASKDKGEAVRDKWSGQYQGPEEPMLTVATDAMAWQRLWGMVSQEPPVAFEPDQTMAVGIFLGMRRTGGYGVEILSAREEGDAFVVQYKERRPGPMDIVTQALTTPYLIQTFPKSSLPVKFQKVEEPQVLE